MINEPGGWGLGSVTDETAGVNGVDSTAEGGILAGVLMVVGGVFVWVDRVLGVAFRVLMLRVGDLENLDYYSSDVWGDSNVILKMIYT